MKVFFPSTQSPYISLFNNYSEFLHDLARGGIDIRLSEVKHARYIRYPILRP